MRLGRGDRKGAFRLAGACFIAGGLAKIFLSHHVGALNAEFNLAFLDRAAAPLSSTAVLSLATFRAPTLDSGAILVNGVRLHLEPVTRAVVAALQDVASLRLDALCARLGDISPDAVHRAVLDLARHDIVTIQP